MKEIKLSNYKTLLDILTPEINSKLKYKMLGELPSLDTLTNEDIGTIIFLNKLGEITPYIILKTNKINIFKMSNDNKSSLNIIILNELPTLLDDYEHGTLIIANKKLMIIYEYNGFKESFVIDKESLGNSGNGSGTVELITYTELEKIYREV